jgi:hypothetical protein
MKRWRKDERFSHLKKYAWFLERSTSCTKDGEFIATHDCTYIACDHCIEEEDKRFFHHYPDGWEMHIFKTKMYGPYPKDFLKVEI